MPWPKLPAVAQTRCGDPDICDTRNCAPRPLNERTGLSVSTFTTSRQPSCSRSVSASYCGVSRKAGSMAADAATMCWIDKRCFMRRQSTDANRDAIDSLRVSTQQYCVPHKHALHLDEIDRKLLDLLQNDAA